MADAPVARILRPVRVGVIGTGRIAELHLAYLARSPLTDLIVVCDRDPLLAARASRLYGGSAITDHNVLLTDFCPEVVHVLTPPATHPSVVAEAAASGAGLVIVEKPAGPSLPATQRLVSAVEEAGCLLTEDHNYRFNSPARRLLAAIDSGEVGRVREIEVRMAMPLGLTRYNDPFEASRYAHKPSGVLEEFLPHLGYLALAFAPRATVTRAAFVKEDVDTRLTPDGAVVDLRTAGTHPVVGRLQFSSGVAPATTTITVRGTAGWGHADLQDPLLRISRTRNVGEPLSPLADQVIAGLGFLRASAAGLLAKLRGSPIYEGIPTFLGATYRAYTSGQHLPVDHGQILDTARLIDEIREAAA